MIVNKNGFTLVELLVVIALIGVVSGIGLLNLASTKGDQNLTTATADLQSLLRIAQNNATTGQLCGPTASANGVYTNQAIDWRVTLTNLTPLTFKMEPNCSDAPTSLYPTKTVTFPSSLSLPTPPMTVTWCGSALNTKVKFANISGVVSFGCGNPSMDINLSAEPSLGWRIQSNPTGTVLTVNADKGGRVYVQ